MYFSDSLERYSFPLIRLTLLKYWYTILPLSGLSVISPSSVKYMKSPFVSVIAATIPLFAFGLSKYFLSAAVKLSSGNSVSFIAVNASDFP
jgi:hypothetical protein